MRHAIARRIRNERAWLLALCAVLWGAWGASAEGDHASAAHEPPAAPARSAPAEHRAADPHPHWSYGGAEGTAHWGSLAPAYRQCSEGRSQSPIDIVDAADVDLPELEFDYRWKLEQLIHNGHALQASVFPGSWLVAGDKRFELLQFHFHSPSENRIRGKPFPLEAHFVHRDAEGGLAVVAVLFDEGAVNPSLAALLSSVPHSAGETEAAHVELAAQDLLPLSRSYYLYSGSLTTPPCTEGVRWFVLRLPLEASAQQIAEFVSAVGPNAREPQPLHRRVVLR